MFCTLTRLAGTTARLIGNAVRAGLDRLGGRLRRLWQGHLDSVTNNAAYAAAAAAVVGGLLGLVSLHDVVAAVLAALVSLYAHGARGHRGEMARVDYLWGAC